MAFEPGYVPNGWARGEELLVTLPVTHPSGDVTLGWVRQAVIAWAVVDKPVNENHVGLVTISPRQVDDAKRWLAWWRGGSVFVFGSNLAGRHGKGAALSARINHGAVYGVGVGRTGDAYAIPTKGHSLQTLPLEEIRPHVRAFLDYARQHQDLIFQVTPVGCGLAGYKPRQIAPMFRGASDNCVLPQEFLEALGGRA